MNIKAVHRTTKVILSGFVALFCLLVGYDNIIDFNINYDFVQHALSMDTMQSWYDSKVMLNRAIKEPILILILYWILIASELIAGFITLFGVYLMIKGIFSVSSLFSRGQALFLIGATLAIFVWYFSIAVIGGEWFQMWANRLNSQMKAYTFAEFILLVMIYTILPSPQEWDVE